MGETTSSSSSCRGLWKKGVVLPMMKKLQIISSLFSREKGTKRVKEGHFVVIATQGWKPERFFIKLGHLENPDFVKLLEQAAEEYGFSQVGALSIPCQPDHLKRIIAPSINHTLTTNK